MKVVSERYSEVMNQVVRPASKFQASLEMIDRSVESDATVTTSDAMPFSTGVLDKVHECDYITFEKDFFKVGSDLRILPVTGFLKNGYVSSAMSDENGVFQETSPGKTERILCIFTKKQRVILGTKRMAQPPKKR